MANLGKRNLLPVVRDSASGLYLDGGELGEILLPRRYAPHGRAFGEQVDVFVYRDSEDRLVATTEQPHAMVGEFAWLKVKEINPQIGAFLDWGLSKDLLLPFREQGVSVRVGQRVIVAVCIDPQTNRIMASARLNRHLSGEPPPFLEGQAVNLLITGQTPLGYNAIVENTHSGLLYHTNITTPLMTGQHIKGFIRTMRPNGKIDLSLDESGYKRVALLTDQIVAALEARGGRLDFDDDTSPEVIRENFSVSKKAFKQALGKLYRDRRIEFLKPGIQLLDNTSWTPGE